MRWTSVVTEIVVETLRRLFETFLHVLHKLAARVVHCGRVHERGEARQAPFQLQHGALSGARRLYVRRVRQFHAVAQRERREVPAYPQWLDCGRALKRKPALVVQALRQTAVHDGEQAPTRGWQVGRVMHAIRRCHGHQQALAGQEALRGGGDFALQQKRINGGWIEDAQDCEANGGAARVPNENLEGIQGRCGTSLLGSQKPRPGG